MKTTYVMAAVAAFTLIAAPAFAQIEAQAETKNLTVSWRDLDLSTPGGKAALTGRIHHAAELVCSPTPDQRDVKAKMAFERCMKKSTDTAIAAIPTASQLAGLTKPAG